MFISKQKAIFTGIAVLTVLFAGAIFYGLGADVREDVAMSKSDIAIKMVREEFVELASPVNRDLVLLAQWGASGMIDLSDPRELNTKLIPLVSSLEIVSSLMLADTEGGEYFLLKNGTSWTVRHAGKYRQDMLATIDHLDETHHHQKTSQARRTFDPRTRTWFAGALQMETDESVYWTKLYTFKTLGKLGVTAATRWVHHKDGSTITVAAMDILLDSLHEFLTQVPVLPGAQILLIRDDKKVIVSSGGDGERPETAFVSMDRLSDGLKKDALAQWAGLAEKSETTYLFHSQGKRWWVSLGPLQPESPKTWIAVIIPEAALMEHIDHKWKIYAVMFSLLLAVLILLTSLVMWKYNRKKTLETTVIPPDEGSVARLIESGEGLTLEFKSTLRTNLKTAKKDKAIEFAWLKSVVAFMNSEGGTLLVGVSDNGDIVGLEADGFENTDKCCLHVKNLIHQHIGSEFAGFIQYGLQTISGKEIVVLECRKADVPVFLKIGKNEDFFIRSGPSSTKLSLSQTVAYLDQRK